jgi:hypothetical protein
LRSRIARKSIHDNLKEASALQQNGSLLSLDQQNLKYSEVINDDKKRPHVQIHNHYNITINQQ